MEDIEPTKYKLVCVATGKEFEDEGWTLEMPCCDSPSMIRASYATKKLKVRADDLGLYKYADWLPVRRALKGSAAPVTYKSKGLASKLGLKNLYITFNGFNPHIGAAMTTCSFKETEAFSVCARIPDGEQRVLVVASAGNTARAFAKVCSENNIPLLLCVPIDNIASLWFDEPLSSCVKLIATDHGSDYFDAIHLSTQALRSHHFFNEGGAKNIARRDGMGTTFLSATTTIGQIPDYYFQAVGSGTGAIAAWEANMRLIEDGSYGTTKAKIIVSQNAPFVPIYDAWRINSREMLPYVDYKARRDAAIISAKVLANRKPPYGLCGGLYDALKDTDGDVIAVTNSAARKAAELFEQTENIDISPAASIATASLIKSVETGKIDKDKIIMLNITGGGEKVYKAGKTMWQLEPTAKFSVDATDDEVVEAVEVMFGFAEPKPKEPVVYADDTI